MQRSGFFFMAAPVRGHDPRHSQRATQEGRCPRPRGVRWPKKWCLRQLSCRWPDCGLVFYICNSCYRRQAYCGDIRAGIKRGGNSCGSPTSATGGPRKRGSITATANGSTGERCRLKVRDRSYFRRQWHIGQDRGASREKREGARRWRNDLQDRPRFERLPRRRPARLHAVRARRARGSKADPAQ